MALNYLILGKKIQLLRKERKISQIRFAEVIDKSPTFVSRMERGIKHPSLETLVEIARFFEVTLDSLVSDGTDSLSSKSHAADQEGILGDCSTYERYVLQESMKEIKRILREGESFLKWGK